jgi:hypothetical protein
MPSHRLWTASCLWLLSHHFSKRQAKPVKVTFLQAPSPVLTFYKSLVISIQPSRNIHAEHPQQKSSREHVQIVQNGRAYLPGYSVEDGENNNDGNSIASDCPHGAACLSLPRQVCGDNPVRRWPQHPDRAYKNVPLYSPVEITSNHLPQTVSKTRYPIAVSTYPHPIARQLGFGFRIW